MRRLILLCWIGKADLEASTHDESGPISQAIEARNYDEVVLLDDWPEDRADRYVDWLKNRHDSIRIMRKHIKLSGPTHFGDIYQAASKTISEKREEYGANLDFVYHLSPGTPAMAAVWILIAKTRYPAELIESSKKYGVKTANIPFDISAEFIPGLIRTSDQTFARLSAGQTEMDPEFDDIIHRSEVMRRAIFMARRIASLFCPVLIEGESGTGKELFARAIHNASERKDGPFMAVNCGAIPYELAESVLFGHTKGAFTGATEENPGHFMHANKGTLFLDEIGELPLLIQVKLLRVIQEGEVQKVGARRPDKIDVRIIAATNRNLIEEVLKGSFREDLFYRLAVVVIKLPPLREREGDLFILIEKLLERINREFSIWPDYKHKTISSPAKNLLIRHTWPGNVRELLNTLTRAAIYSMDSNLEETDILEAFLTIPASDKGIVDILNQPINHGFSLPKIMEIVASHYLERALKENNGNKTNAAKALGLKSYQCFDNWKKKYWPKK